MTSRGERGSQINLGVLGPETVLSVEAVCNAIRFIRSFLEPNPPSLTKPDTSPVTIADFVVQALIVSRLTRDFTGDPIVAEEDAAPLRAVGADELRGRVIELVRKQLSDASPEQVLAWIDQGTGACGRRFWAVDPIDGTRGLIRGGQYVIAVALIVDGVVRVGVLGCPQLSPDPDRAVGGVAIAVRGHGAWWMPIEDRALTRLRVSTQADVALARALHSYESLHADVSQLHRVLRAFGCGTSPVLMDSQAKHVLLAAGQAELLLRVPVDPQYHEAIWDHAAGSLLIEEAGGRVTDLDGRPLDFATGRRLVRNRGLIASNGLVHEAVLRVV